MALVSVFLEAFLAFIAGNSDRRAHLIKWVVPALREFEKFVIGSGRALEGHVCGLQGRLAGRLTRPFKKMKAINSASGRAEKCDPAWW